MTAYPNPMAEFTVFKFRNQASARIAVDVFDLNGRLIERVAEETFGAGEHQIRWEIPSLPAGTYLAQISKNGEPTGQSFKLVKAN